MPISVAFGGAVDDATYIFSEVTVICCCWWLIGGVSDVAHVWNGKRRAMWFQQHTTQRQERLSWLTRFSVDGAVGWCRWVRRSLSLLEVVLSLEA